MEQGGIHERPWIYIGQNLFLPQASQWKFLKALHDPFHIGRDATTTMANKLFVGNGLTTALRIFVKPVPFVSTTSLGNNNNNKNKKHPFPDVKSLLSEEGPIREKTDRLTLPKCLPVEDINKGQIPLLD